LTTRHLKTQGWLNEAKHGSRGEVFTLGVTLQGTGIQYTTHWLLHVTCRPVAFLSHEQPIMDNRY